MNPSAPQIVERSAWEGLVSGPTAALLGVVLALASAWFLWRERQENASNPESQQLSATFRLADRVIHNDADLESLRRTVVEVVAECEATGATGSGRD